MPFPTPSLLRPPCRSVPRTACTAALAFGLASAQAGPAPRCPGPNAYPYPAYAPLDAPPAVDSWRELAEVPIDCFVALNAPAELAIALAGEFRHEGTTDDLAARLGAISTTIDLPYWSVTDAAWQPLASDAGALGSSDASNARADFGAAEVRSSDTLYFMQNDTRSWGDNVYLLRTLQAAEDRLVVETANVSAIRLGPVTLFGPGAIASVQFVEKLEGSTWGYYGLTLIRDTAFEAREKSLVNRQAALYRLLIGEAPDGRPPLAP